MSFSKDFRWGTATASYQIEGGWNADDKGLSVWDQMSRWSGRIKHGETGDVACDHFHRYEEDLGLMKEVGLSAYRFSIGWSRVIPAGTGRISEKGLAFYDKLVDGLLAANIEPWVTLFHWDYPLELYYKGGWLNGDSPSWFADYSEVVARRLGDRVKHWITLNEPSIFLTCGHDMGIHAPGLRLPQANLVRITHNVLKAHGQATAVIKKEVKSAQVGWSAAMMVVEPEDGKDPQQAKAAYNAQFSLPPQGFNFGFGIAQWTDPVFLGKYPQDYLDTYGDDLPPNWQDDMSAINQPLDFCGLNIYQTVAWANQGDVSVEYNKQFGDGAARTYSNWPITPAALYWGPKHIWDRYHVPVVITENGMCGHDWVHEDGKVHDHHRIDFLKAYIREFKRATSDGVQTLGYFQWTLIDNFEWAEGYDYRFGIIHIDYQTQKRTIKESGRWYAKLIQTNGSEL